VTDNQQNSKIYAMATTLNFITLQFQQNKQFSVTITAFSSLRELLPV